MGNQQLEGKLSEDEIVTLMTYQQTTIQAQTALEKYSDYRNLLADFPTLKEMKFTDVSYLVNACQFQMPYTHFAVSQGNIALVKSILKDKVGVNDMDSLVDQVISLFLFQNGNKACHIAARQSSKKMILLMIQAQVEFNEEKNLKGERPKDLAKIFNNLEFVKALKQNKESSSSEESSSESEEDSQTSRKQSSITQNKKSDWSNPLKKESDSRSSQYLSFRNNLDRKGDTNKKDKPRHKKDSSDESSSHSRSEQEDQVNDSMRSSLPFAQNIQGQGSQSSSFQMKYSNQNSLKIIAKTKTFKSNKRRDYKTHYLPDIHEHRNYEDKDKFSSIESGSFHLRKKKNRKNKKDQVENFSSVSPEKIKDHYAKKITLLEISKESGFYNL